MWPLGGIRTYLKYNYHYFPRDKYDVTLLAVPSQESEAIEKDMAEEGIKVVWAKPLLGKNVLFLRTAFQLMKKRYDLIHSQGFISGFHVSVVNRFFRKPHVMTIHGILEEKWLSGKLKRLKRTIFAWIITNVNVFHGVGDDILYHFSNKLPNVANKRRIVVIKNGIDPTPFMKDYPQAPEKLREKLRVDRETFVFGFFGRFMPQKGFEYVIESIKMIKKGHVHVPYFKVMAVGSGDYEKHYKKDIERAGLKEYFCFLPFCPNVAELMQGCDVILMPSIWEAYGLVSSEVLCCGIPIIATDCIGLREAVSNTPAIVIPSKNSDALARAMTEAVTDENLKEPFIAFRPTAAKRFDVKHSAEKLVALFDNILDLKSEEV